MKRSKDAYLTTTQRRVMSYMGAGCCFSSELIHLCLLPGQYETYLGYGIIFLLIAMTQGTIGAHLLFEPNHRLLTFGLWANALVVVLYCFTHTIGVPVGLAFLPLSIDAWGITATIAEIGAIILLVFLQHDMPRRKRNKKRKETALVRF
jgi:hypothetical protein